MEASVATLPSRSARVTVFLVEDSAVIRERLLDLLHDIAGVEVLGYCETAAEAIAEIVRTQPDVVVLDLKLKMGNGLQVLSAVKHALPAVTVVMLTNYATPEIRARCLNAGADHFLDKSNEFQHIRPILEDLEVGPQPGTYPC